MGGAFGHIKHPFELTDVTLGELQAKLLAVARGEVDVYEKFDGINIMFTIINKTLFVARAANEIKTGGIPYADLATRFPSSQTLGLKVVSALGSLASFSSKNSPFEEGCWYSADVISREHRNVILYDHDSITVHPLKITNNSVQWGVDFSCSTNEHEDWTIVFPKSRRVNVDVDISFDGLPLDVPLIDLYVKNACRELMHAGFGEEYSLRVAQRVWHCEGHKTLTELKKNLPPVDRRFVSSFVNDEVNVRRKARRSVEKNVQLFSDALLRGQPSAIIQEGAKETSRIRASYFVQANKLFASSVRRFDDDVTMADDLESFAANIEGLVFQFNDNIVKLTGSYKYINQVVGFDRYGR